MEITIGVVVAGRHERAVVVERAVFSGILLVRVVRREIHNNLDPQVMRSRDEIIECGPGFRAVAKEVVDLRVIVGRITVVGRGRISVTIWNVDVDVFNRWGNPDGGNAHSVEISQVRLNPR